MKIVVTAREVQEKGSWDRFCEMKGLSVWCVNEGMSSDEEFTVTEEEAKELGLLPAGER